MVIVTLAEETAARVRQFRLSASVALVLSTLPLHHERAIRDAFGLAPNPLLEDVAPGDLQEAIGSIRGDARDLLASFLG